MYFESDLSHLNAMSAIHAVNETLRRIDARLVDHGDRAAFLACGLCEAGNLALDEKTLFLLSLFHDIGAYKTDEIDRMLEFETHDVWNHSIYGYLFLKYMTSLKDNAAAILYHHYDWKSLHEVPQPVRDCAALIHLADRLDMMIRAAGPDSDAMRGLLANDEGSFCPQHIELLRRCLREGSLLEQARQPEVYHVQNARRLDRFNISSAEALSYLKMVVYSIDFRSEHTVTHSINTISLSLDIARHFGSAQPELDDIYLGALLHDVGKIAIPNEILEYPGRLSTEQMTVMRTHVVETERLIRGAVPDHICEIAIRHHEKLDGSGYPAGLTGSELTFPQRIVAVADIVSALSSRRSYKAPFPKEKTLAILREMSVCQLDKRICAYMIENYDAVMARTEPERAAVIDRYQSMMQEFAALKQLLDPQHPFVCSLSVPAASRS